MCGIVARIGFEEGQEFTFRSLKRLEYRGYDSFGFLCKNFKSGGFKIIKESGSVSEEIINNFYFLKSNIMLAHTRWATHGFSSEKNAHPIFDRNKKFFVVMNGIIENFKEIIKEENLVKDTDTDTEIIPLLFSKYFTGNLVDTFRIILPKLKGEFSFILNYDNQLLVYKNFNPIICGISHGEFIFSSDCSLVQENSEEFFVMEDDSFFYLVFDIDTQATNFSYFKGFNEAEAKFKKSPKKNLIDENIKGYFMRKEIEDQKNISRIFLDENIKNTKFLYDSLKSSRFKEVIITGAGSSYNAALFLHYFLLKKGILSRVILASELMNYSNVIKDSLIIVFSQSGETADLIHPLKILKNFSSNKVFSIINNRDSTLDRLADRSLYLNCGQEIAVASTKAFTFQIFITELLDIFFRGRNSSDLLKEVSIFRNDFNEVLGENSKEISKIVNYLINKNSCFYIGRGDYFPLAIEGALKMKEITYIHAEGFAGGELKHGSLALIEEGVLVFVLGDSEEVLLNAEEIKTRKGKIVTFSDKNLNFDFNLKIPSRFKEIFSTILMQEIAYRTSLSLKRNPDKPRNLAKCVTVK